MSPQGNGLLSPQAAYGSAFNSPAPTPTGEKRSFEHPGGYQQNPYAADMTPEQRFNTQHGAQSPTLGYTENRTNSGFGGFKSPGVFNNFNGAPSPGAGRGAGILNGDGKGEDSSIIGTLGGWMKGAGKMLGQLEGEAWKRINRE